MATKYAITISFNEDCGQERARFLFGRIWSRACKRTGKKFTAPKGYGSIDRGVKQKTHIHLVVTVAQLKDWFFECLQESCKHFNERFESWNKEIPKGEEIGYFRYIDSKRMAGNSVTW